MLNRLVGATGIVIGGVGVVALVRRFRADDTAARARVEAVDRRVASTSFGDVEYALDGESSPLLVVHGIFGGRDAGLLSFDHILADRRVISPSRFGYLGSAIPTQATPARQADAFVELFDHLDIDRVDVVGYSAGSVSVIQLALRHPHSVVKLVRASLISQFRWASMSRRWANGSGIGECGRQLENTVSRWRRTRGNGGLARRQ